MRRLLAGIMLAFLAATIAFAEVRVIGETKVEPGRLVRLDADAANTKISPTANVRWKVTGMTLGADGKIVQADCERIGTRLIFTGPPGEYAVAFRLIDFEAKLFEESDLVVTIGKGETGPNLAPPPPPPPPPQNPDAPIPHPGFRVLMVYESSALAKMPISQQGVLYSKTVRDYLNTKCALGPDQKSRDWRCWDKDVDTSNETKLWQEAMKRPRKSVPWIVISDGKTGTEQELPIDIETTMRLLRKYGGE